MDIVQTLRAAADMAEAVNLDISNVISITFTELARPQFFVEPGEFARLFQLLGIFKASLRLTSSEKHATRHLKFASGRCDITCLVKSDQFVDFYDALTDRQAV